MITSGSYDAAAVREHVDFLALLADRGVKVRATGRGRWVASCVFHAERTPSFVLDTEKGLAHCFGCKWGGDGLKFVMDFDHVDFPEALQMLGERFNVPPREGWNPEQRRKYALAKEGAPVIAGRIANFSLGLFSVAEGELERAAAITSQLLELDLDPRGHVRLQRQVDLLREATPRQLAEIWRDAVFSNPAGAAALERIGAEERENTETITLAVIDAISRLELAA